MLKICLNIFIWNRKYQIKELAAWPWVLDENVFNVSSTKASAWATGPHTFLWSLIENCFGAACWCCQFHMWRFLHDRPLTGDRLCVSNMFICLFFMSFDKDFPLKILWFCYYDFFVVVLLVMTLFGMCLCANLLLSWTISNNGQLV